MFMKTIVALIFCTVSSTAQAQKILVNTNSGTSIEYNLSERDPNTGGLPACNELLGDARYKPITIKKLLLTATPLLGLSTESALGDATDEAAVLREELAATVEALAAIMEELVAVYEENDALESDVDIDEDGQPNLRPDRGAAGLEADSDPTGVIFSIELQDITILSYQP